MVRSSNKPYLSVIIPVYNEEGRVQRVKKVFSYLQRQSFSSEIIIVNDGSNDSTIEKVNKLHDTIQFKLLSYQKNRGKGFAIKTGMLHAKGQFRLFMDVDLSTPINEFKKFLPVLKPDSIIIATRKTNQSYLLKHQPKIRELLGKAFTLLSQYLLRVYVSDFTCGFKCFSSKVANDVFSKSIITGWGFDSEILYIAKSKKYEIHEIPVSWKNDPSSKVRFPKDMIRSLNDLLKIRINSFRGKYD